MAEIGDIIGQRYLLTGELGQGAMSIVYAATDQKLGREVAVKMLLPHLARQPEAVIRFQREAAAVAQLDDHPNIVRIYDYSGPDVSPAYLVMELVEGESLAEFMANNSSPWPDLAALLVEPLTAALALAHSRQIIHRDIKPENIMVTKSGQLKLVDFGIARAADVATITATGSLMGSPAYMAPEYLNGEAADFTADIYSIGVLLYHLSTGHLPYEAPTPAALFKRVCEGNYPPAEQVEPRLTKVLNNIINKAMALDKRCRYQSAEEMQTALKEHLKTLNLPDNSLAPYLSDPQTFAEKELGSWLYSLNEQAQAAAKIGRTNRALGCYQLILAFRPDDEPTMMALKKLQSWLKVREQLPKVALGLVALGVILTGWYVYQGQPEDKPLPAPELVALPAATTQVESDQVTDHSDGHSEAAPRPPIVDVGTTPAIKTELPAAPLRSRPARHGRSIVGKGAAKKLSESRSDNQAETSVGSEVMAGPGANDHVADDNATPAVAVTPIEVTLHAFPFATIWVDGELKAKNAMNPLSLNLAPGNHELRFEHPAALPEQRLIKLEKNQAPMQIKVHMEPLPASVVVVAPKGTIVELDNKRWLTLTDGNNEARLIELPDKQFRHSYKITLTEPGQEPWSRFIELTAGKVTTVGRRE